MKHAAVMIKPASSLCNLRCRYCFYANVAELREVRSYGIMKPETTEAMLRNILADLKTGDSVTFAFQGGEPTMAGLEYFRHFTGITEKWPKGITVSYSLQTNATLLDDEWCNYLHKYRYLVGVSLDLLPESHDDARVDSSGRGTYKAVLSAIRRLELHQAEYNILCTLTESVARHPAAVWNQLKKLSIRYVQFTPCLADLECEGGNRTHSKYTLTPERYASFYTALFRLWLNDFKAGHYRSVRLFDELIGQLATGIPSTCSVHGRCSPQFVIEADGNVYPCDFYCIDRYKLGVITLETLGTLRNGEKMTAFLTRDRVLPELCGGCRYHALCGGGCRRMQNEVCCSADGKFCGYRAFLDDCMPDLLRIAAEERRYRQGAATR